MTDTPVARSLLEPGRETSDDRIPPLLFDSAASLVDERGEALTDDEIVAVWAAATARNEDADDRADAHHYGHGTRIPLVAVDGSVVGFGGILVADDTNWQYGNEQFVANVWDAVLDGSGTVLWDEGHDQYYDLASVSAFVSYVESRGYEIRTTNAIADDLEDADAAVISAPSDPLTEQEVTAIEEFVSGGGGLFLHDHSDYRNRDATDQFDALASALEVGFRFNDDQVVDPVVNEGEPYRPTTDRFNDRFPFFETRDGLGLDGAETYAVTVTDVSDGDTVTVEFADGRVETVRVLDVDTPETASNRQHERVQEWEGIEDVTHLQEWAETATQFARESLAGEQVALSFDAGSAVRDEFGRLLGYLEYDANGEGDRDDSFNRALVERGYARVYDGSTTTHDAALAAETEARREGRGLWAGSDPAKTPSIRNRPVEKLFFPTPATVHTTGDPIDPSRVPVTAAESATQARLEGDDAVAYEDALPLVGVDETVGVAAIGGPLFDERYEKTEGYPVDTAPFGNYVFLANLIDHLASTDGEVVIEGGHGQFPVSFGRTAEDAAYFLRYLEGQGISLVGRNDVTEEALEGARALVVTSAPEPFTDDEIATISAFLDAGGALLLVGTGPVTPAARANLNDLAAGVGTDLRLNADRVRDPGRHLYDDPSIPVTSSFDDSFPLFVAYDGEEARRAEPTTDRWSGGELSIADVRIDDSGGDHDDLTDRCVVFENVGEERLGLTGWTVRDAADNRYSFPDGFVLRPGETVCLHAGEGADRQTHLYWGSATVLRHGTLVVADETGTPVIERSR